MTPSEAISPCVACLSQADKLAIIAKAGLAYLENPGGGGGGGGSSAFGTVKWFGPYTVNYTAIGSTPTDIALILDNAGSNDGILEDIFIQVTSTFSATVNVRPVGYTASVGLDLTSSSSVINSIRDADLWHGQQPNMPNKAVPSFTLEFDSDGATLTTGQCKVYAKYVSPPFGTISLD